MKKIRVITTLKNGIRDNQAQAVQQSLKNTFNYTNIINMRIGKIIDIEVDDTMPDEQIKEIAKAISNPIMDDVTIEEY